MQLGFFFSLVPNIDKDKQILCFTWKNEFIQDVEHLYNREAAHKTSTCCKIVTDVDRYFTETIPITIYHS